MAGQNRATTGKIAEVKPEDFAPSHAVGNGKLPLIDPLPKRYPAIGVEREGGVLQVEVLVR